MRMLILSGKEALQKQIRNIRPLEKSINEYIESRNDYRIFFCYYDVPGEYHIKAAEQNAEAIRDYVMQIEKKTGEIDFVLLLGGDKVVPFFRLDNPCDDADEQVFSDNPYASRDENYTIPERVCARIPDNESADYMTKQLTKSKVSYHESFGLTAGVWQRASENVYRPIGDPKDLKVSPPVTSDTFKKGWLQQKDYLYFNVHGSKVASNWYGQHEGEYPVAMQPRNIEKAAGVVASEACYGAYIMGKTKDNAISLRFLDEEQILGFCGSTTIAYGPVQPPSSEADLLVKYFFEYLAQGLTLGESFKNAKLDFARKALRRHGFLDDDDKKTLLQFVLYGDPTLRARTKNNEELMC
jgi:hypothetical protein